MYVICACGIRLIEFVDSILSRAFFYISELVECWKSEDGHRKLLAFNRRRPYYATKRFVCECTFLLGDMRRNIASRNIN